LSSEPINAEWAAIREERIAFELEKLELPDLDDVVINCRTTLCGVAFQFAAAESAFPAVDEAGARTRPRRQISDYIVDAFKEPFARLDIGSISYEILSSDANDDDVLEVSAALLGSSPPVLELPVAPRTGPVMRGVPVNTPSEVEAVLSNLRQRRDAGQGADLDEAIAALELRLAQLRDRAEVNRQE
jgi:hypothetical protein